MANWGDWAIENFRAAGVLREQKLSRASVSRSYYAVYCAFTKMMVEKGVRFSAFRGGNPSHREIMALSRTRLGRNEIVRHTRYDVRKMRTYLAQLLHYRIIADYRPGLSLLETDAVNSLRLARYTLEGLGILEIQGAGR